MKELELILAAVANLGAAGKEAFIWWLIIDKVVVGMFILTAAISIPWIISRAFGRFNSEHLALEAIAKELGMEYFWASSGNDDHNVNGLIKRLHERIRKTA